MLLVVAAHIVEPLTVNPSNVTFVSSSLTGLQLEPVFVDFDTPLLPPANNSVPFTRKVAMLESLKLLTKDVHVPPPSVDIYGPLLVLANISLPITASPETK